MIVKKIFSFAASSINLIIFIIFIKLNSNAAENNKNSYSEDEGVVAIMYHRFNENKYPSTNIRIEVFRKHLELIEQSGYDFYNPNEFENEILKPKTKQMVAKVILKPALWLWNPH